MRHTKRWGVVLLIMLLVGAACAHTTIGKAVQAAEAQKKLVEAVAIEFVVLHEKKQVDDAVFNAGHGAYDRWAAGERALAESLAEWKTVSSVQNDKKLEAALQNAKGLSESFLAFARQFINVDAVAAKLGAKP